MPPPDTGFADRIRMLCPAFRATETLPARKSEVLAGEIDGAPVVAKRLARPNDVWAWYLAREIAIYRAFAAEPPPVRAPKLVAATDDVLVIERLPGASLAQRRNPFALLEDGVVRGILAMHDRFSRYRGALPSTAPSPAVRAQLRSRFLEDPTSDWIREGIARAADRELLSKSVAAKITESLADAVAVPSHGDLLLRHCVGDGLVDWECAGMHLADWDLALLWSQLHPDRRPLVEAHAHSRGFLGVAAFALVREISILLAFRAGPQHANLARLRREVADVCGRIDT